MRRLNNRFKFDRGNSASHLYGLEAWDPKDDTFLVEGPTDVITGKIHGQNIIGLSSAAAWNERLHAKAFEACPIIYFIEEPDQGGKTLRAKLAQSSISKKILAVSLGEFKDLNELHCADPKKFTDRLYVAVKKAEKLQPVSAAVVSLAEVEEQPVEWLTTHAGIALPLSKLNLFAGDPGVSKSTLTCDLAAAVSRGEARGPWNVTMKGAVLMLSAEDDAADTLKPRLRIAGADLSQVFAMTAVRDYDANGNVIERSFNLSLDAARMAEVLQEKQGTIRLIIIDPISAYQPGASTAIIILKCEGR